MIILYFNFGLEKIYKHWLSNLNNIYGTFIWRFDKYSLEIKKKAELPNSNMWDYTQDLLKMYSSGLGLSTIYLH